FRVLNIKDLNENYGDITKLIVVGDNLYALQENAVSHIGFGDRTLETADGLTLVIQSGQVLGTVTLLDTTRGTQHLRSVLPTGNVVYFVDNLNRTINRLAGRQVEVLSESDMASELRKKLSTTIPE